MRIDNFFLQGDVGHSGLPQWLAERLGYFGDSVQDVQLTVWINSPGGDLLAALEAINLIKSSPIPIVTVINGHAESAALLIALAGTRRLAFDTSWGMAHHFSTAAEGNYHDLTDMVRSNELLSASMKDIYTNYTLVPEDIIDSKMMGRGTTWLSAVEMLEYGMIDEIITAKTARSSVLNYKKVEDNEKKSKTKVKK